ncbi:putative glycoside hydrolase family 16 protein [Erysiphe neolycopersici]|uniref:Putative glycoside hydrolase family 16 protein n=1 Tax=Erysiphe neolycopersici TaxID=212602 RepID=A0A420HGC9_9PEZI|nr:putative glycoside hydrolase family 16 protein [Erysiphe neolycopersici]
MRYPTIATALFLHLLPTFTTAAVKDNGKKCDCFRTTGPSAGYFTNHMFQDFRKISTGDAPKLLTTTKQTTEASVTNNFFKSDSWTKNWYIQHWNNTDSMNETSATLLMVNSPNNVYIEKSPSDPKLSWMTLRTARVPDFQSTAEIDTVTSNMLFLSVRYMARIHGDPGACAGFFTYLPPGSDPTTVQEADIEILTGAPVNYVQFTNQPSFDDQGRELLQASKNTSVPKTNDYSQWNVWRMDWMPDQTSWYVNDIPVANISFQTPKDPAGLIMNMWSDGGLWTGNMSIGQSAYMNVQWIEIAYNTSGPQHNKKRDMNLDTQFGNLNKRAPLELCQAVCSIDENVTAVGTPKLLYGIGNPSKTISIFARYLPLTLILVAIFSAL